MPALPYQDAKANLSGNVPSLMGRIADPSFALFKKGGPEL
jgi:hypothetical protein